jgi:hypothetical protein
MTTPLHYAALPREDLIQECEHMHARIERLLEALEVARQDRADAIAAYRQLIINHERAHNDDWK